jgi:hypothetical protein
MPGTAIGIHLGIYRSGQRTVRAPSLCGRRALVCGQTNQRVAERCARKHLQETIHANVGACGLVDPKTLGRSPNKTRIPRRIGCRHQEQHLAGRRKLRNAAAEARDNPGLEWARRRDPVAARKLGTAQSSRQFEQCEWVSPRFGEDPLEYIFIEGIGQNHSQQGSAIILIEAGDRKGLEPAQTVGNATCTEQHCDVLRFQPMSQYGECPCRLSVDPLRIVDETEERLIGSGERQKTQQRKADEQSIWRHAVVETQCYLECPPLRRWQRRD